MSLAAARSFTEHEPAAQAYRCERQGLPEMADIQVCGLDDRIAEALELRARRHGISMEEEVRRILSSSVNAGLEELRRGVDAIRARTKLSTRPEHDSVRIIREERDAWG